jgi:hypothetical protein
LPGTYVLAYLSGEKKLFLIGASDRKNKLMRHVMLWSL